MSHENEFYARQNASVDIDNAFIKLKTGIRILQRALQNKAELDSQLKAVSGADAKLSNAITEHQKILLEHELSTVKERVTVDVERAASLLAKGRKGYYAQIYSPRIEFWQNITEWLAQISKLNNLLGCDIAPTEALSQDALYAAIKRNPKNVIPLAYIVSHHDAQIAKSIGLIRCLHHLQNPQISSDEAATLKELMVQWGSVEKLEAWRKQRSIDILCSLTDYDGGVQHPERLTVNADSLAGYFETLPLFMPDAYMAKCEYRDDLKSITSYSDDLLYLMEMYEISSRELVIDIDEAKVMNGPYYFTDTSKPGMGS